MGKQTQNRWEFVIATVRGGVANCDVIFQGGLNICDEM